MKKILLWSAFSLLALTVHGQCEPVAICQNVTVYLDAAGEGTITDADLDGGSMPTCGGELTFSASQTSFNCDDIFDGPVPPSLVISAAFDCSLPGGLPKGVELYVINDIPNLGIYGLGSANNGGGTDGVEFTFPEVTVSAGTYIYVASEEVEFENWFGFAPDYTSGAMLINGDDAVELFEDGVVIDVFGDIDVDGSGEPWEYLDGWAHRVSDTGPDGATFEIGNWTFSGPNALDGETDNATAASPVPVGVYTTPPTTGVSVELTVTSEEMLSTTCMATVMVFDTLAPTMSCVGDLTFALDETGTLSLDVSDIDAGTEDGCGIDVISLSETEFTCEDEGEHEIMLYATDIYGNMDSCSTTITIDASDVISIVEEVVTDASCNGFEDGSIDITFEGGTPDITFDWDNDGTGDFDDTEDLGTLGAGTYVIIIEDANGCTATSTFEIGEPDAIEITTTVTNESCPGAADGSIVIESIEGGTGPYTGGDDLTDLEAGTHPITITDANGCSEIFEIEVGVDATIDNTITESGTDLTSNQDGATYQWVTCPDYEAIDGATDQTFTPTEAGEYAVIVTIDGGCSDTSDCVTFGFDNIEEITPLNVVLYPNPSSGLVNAQLSGLNGSALITVLDIKGSVVFSITTNNTNEQLDLTSVEKGVYFVQIKSDNALLTKKITVSK